MSYRFKENFKDTFGELYVIGGNNLMAIGEVEERLTALVENEIDSLQTEIRDKTTDHFSQQFKAREIYEREIQTLRNSHIFERNVVSQKHAAEILRMKNDQTDLIEQHKKEIEELRKELQQSYENYHDLCDLYHADTANLAYKAKRIEEKNKDVVDFSAITFVPAVPHKVEEIKTEQKSIDYSSDLSKIEALKF